MSKKAIKTIGGLILSLALIISFSGAAFAAAVTVSCSPSNSPANPIYDDSGVTGNPSDYLPSGRFVQIIESDDATPGAPDPATGAPAGDTVKATGTLSANGTFSGGASIASNKYVYIRAWDTWNGSGAPTGKYGTSTPANVGSGFTYTYKPASFATTTSMAGSIQLSSATYSVNENGGTVTITVTRTGGSSGAVGISYATSNGTATAGSDYTATSGTLSWANGDTANKTFTIPITDDSAYEGNETFTVTLSAPTGGATLGSPSSATVTIVDNETPPSAGSLQFSPATYSVNENGGTVTITVTRTGGSSGAVGVSYRTINGTATAGSDYTATNGTLSWANGETASKTFNVPITDDSAYEGNETFTVTLESPTGGATLGSPSSATVTIVDNDSPPSTLTITTTSLPSGTVGTDYSQTLAATGGTPPYTWSISGGSLPAGLSLNTSTGQISGTPTTAGTSNFTVRVTDSASGSDTQDLSITISPSGTTSPTISSITPNNPYVGQTIVISGSGFGASKGSSTVTIGGVTANPTAWSDTSITLAVPSGAANGNVVVTVGGASANSTITLQTGGVVIDDVEGGSVGTWPEPASGLAQSGYYTFGAGIEPDNSSITANGPQAEAKYHGAKGMKVKYSYVSDWGGGWGAKLANTLDLSSYDKISFYIKWDGSANALKFSLKDSDGTSVAATISNSTLAALSSGYGQVTVSKSSFAADPDGSDAGNNGTFNWDKVVNYNFVYNTNKTSTNYQYIDSITAGEVNLGTGEGGTVTPTGEVVITSVTPPSGPAGTKMTISGSGFGDTQGSSQLVFENTQTKVNYQVEVISWSANTIEAIVPRLAPEGIYTLKVIRIAITRGTMQAFESNPASFQVTAAMSAAGTATIYPNPFNPLASGTRANGVAANSTTMVFNASGVSSVGVYIYDAAGRLVYHTSASGSEVNWNGRDDQGNLVGDGLYLVRIVNEDSKSLIAKGKVLVIKRAQ